MQMPFGDNVQGVPKKRTPWFILTITSVNMDRF